MVLHKYINFSTIAEKRQTQKLQINVTLQNISMTEKGLIALYFINKTLIKNYVLFVLP